MFKNLIFISFIVCLSACNNNKVKFLTSIDKPYEQLAANKLTEVGNKVLDNKIEVSFTINSELPAESFGIVADQNNINIIAADATGILYATHQLIDQIKVKGNDGIETCTEEPYMPFRAIKFNLPWDSYRHSPSLEQHIETCKNLEFWQKFLDMMVENRFNMLSLWNLHPFNYMICPEGYPSACTFSEEEMAEWKALYHGIFAMAKERGIETYIVNWNIYVPAPFAKKHNVCLDNLDHNHGGTGDTSQIVMDYTKQCVKQVINEYPNLTGIGFSHGEVMGGMSPEEREEWLMETFVEGIRAADRKVKLIHRVPLSANNAWQGSASYEAEDMTRRHIEKIDCVIEPIWVEIKFNWSHAHSTPKLVKTHGGKLHDRYWNPEPKNHKICWTARNEDFFCLRWGDPDFVRAHIKENVKEHVGGYFLGSECYIPAKDYFTKLDSVDWNYAFERQWLFYKSWGRNMYNPKTSDDVFRDEFSYRYGSEYGKLFDLYKKASKIPLWFNSFYDIKWDFTFYAEGFLSFFEGRGTDFININDLINQAPLDPTYMGIKEFVALKQKGYNINDTIINPQDLANDLTVHCEATLFQLIEYDLPTNNSLLYEMRDIEIWCYLGLYLSNKIKAGIELEMFRHTGNEEHKTASIKYIDDAINQWQYLSEVSSEIYNEMPLVHLTWTGDHYFHWNKLIDIVEYDKELILAE